jgi:hypothetical protein
VDRAEVDMCAKRGQVLYDHWLPAIRNPVPIHDTTFDWNQWLESPSRHFSGQCQRLFGDCGREINIWKPDQPQILSALYDLPAVRKAFSTRPEFDTRSDSIPGFRMEVPPDTPVRTYRLANLQHHGNFQSDGPLHVMLPYITSINAKINPRPQGSQEEPIATVIPGKMQGYASIAHLMRESTPQHDAQKGENVGFAGGAYRKGAVADGKYAALKTRMAQNLPHMRFREKIRDCSQRYKRLRTEVNYSIRLDSIKPDDRNGQYESSFCLYYHNL